MGREERERHSKQEEIIWRRKKSLFKYTCERRRLSCRDGCQVQRFGLGKRDGKSTVGLGKRDGKSTVVGPAYLGRSLDLSCRQGEPGRGSCTAQWQIAYQISGRPCIPSNGWVFRIHLFYCPAGWGSPKGRPDALGRNPWTPCQNLQVLFCFLELDICGFVFWMALMLLRHFLMVQEKEGWDLSLNSQAEAKCWPWAVIPGEGKVLQGGRMHGGRKSAPCLKVTWEKTARWEKHYFTIRAFFLGLFSGVYSYF